MLLLLVVSFAVVRASPEQTDYKMTDDTDAKILAGRTWPTEEAALLLLGAGWALLTSLSDLLDWNPRTDHTDTTAEGSGHTTSKYLCFSGDVKVRINKHRSVQELEGWCNFGKFDLVLSIHRQTNK